MYMPRPPEGACLALQERMSSFPAHSFPFQVENVNDSVAHGVADYTAP